MNKRGTRGAKILAFTMALALLSAACGGDDDESGSGSSDTPAAQSGPAIKLGTAIDLSGGVAATGKDALAGMQFAIDELNAGKGVINRKVELISRDNQSKPEIAVEEARKLVEEEKVAALIAPASSAAALAVSTSVSKPLKVPMFTHSSNTDALTVKQFHPYIFSMGPNALMEANAQAKALSAEKHVKYGLIAADYEGGHANIETFKEYIKKYKPEVQFTVEIFPPLGEKDYTSYINRLISAKPDFVFSVLFGGDLIAFTKQAKAVDFFNKVPFTALYDSTTLAALGADAPEGTRGYGRAPFYAVKTPQAQKFVTDFKAKNGTYPSDWTLMGYDCVMAWAQGVEKAGKTDADAVVAALESIKVKTLRGEVTLRKVDHQADVPEYYGAITKPDPTYGFPIWSNPQEIPGSQIILPEADVLKRRG
jgi:branched-chain amino acid transport system substrate-binding protein